MRRGRRRQTRRTGGRISFGNSGLCAGENRGTIEERKDQLYVDFNLNMAVYVVPVLNYSGNEWCEKLAKRMVELWNEKKVSKAYTVIFHL